MIKKGDNVTFVDHNYVHHIAKVLDIVGDRVRVRGYSYTGWYWLDKMSTSLSELCKRWDYALYTAACRGYIDSDEYRNVESFLHQRISDLETNQPEKQK